jgi:putative ABC transport system substrate-binding protein
MEPLRRRLLVAAACAATIPACLGALAAEPKRVAWLGFPGEPVTSGHVRIVRERLKERGFVEGQNVVTRLFVPRSNDLADLRAALDEALAWKPSVIEVRTSRHAKIAARATTTVPIVFSWVGDPILAGIVSDKRKPGGNVTGVSQNALDLSQKRMELARELAPAARTVALIYDRRGGIHEAGILPAIRTAASTLGFTVNEVDVALHPNGLAQALASAAPSRPCAAVVAGAIIDPRYLDSLVEFQWRTGIPVIDDLDAAVRAGVALALTETTPSHFRRVADVTALVLAGADPGTIPVDAAARIELHLNAASARRMGIVVPQSIRLRADQVIE